MNNEQQDCECVIRWRETDSSSLSWSDYPAIDSSKCLYPAERRKREELEKALRYLSAEAKAILSQADVTIHGTTNINCMKRRIAEADALLKGEKV